LGFWAGRKGHSTRDGSGSKQSFGHSLAKRLLQFFFIFFYFLFSSAAPPPPKYSEDHVRAVADQVRVDAATPARNKDGSAASTASTSSLKQANDWGEAFEAAADPKVDSKGAQQQQPLQLQHSSRPAAAVPAPAAQVVISDGWGDEDKWSDEEANDDAGWGSVYKPTVAAVPVPVAKHPQPAAIVPPKAPVSSIVSAKTAPTTAAVTTKPASTTVSAPLAAAGGSSTVAQPVWGSAPQPVWGQQQPTLGQFAPKPVVQPGAFVTTLPVAATTTGWESFGFGAAASPSGGAASTGGAGGGAANDGWGDLSFLSQTSKPKPATSTPLVDSTKSTKKTKKKDK
jgi:hypothetical protein